MTDWKPDQRTIQHARLLQQEVQSEYGRLLQRIGELVKIESPTGDSRGIDRCASRVEDWIAEAGGRSERLAPPLRGRRRAEASPLLAGHFAADRNSTPPPTLPRSASRRSQPASGLRTPGGLAAKPGERKPAMVLGHLDTVWPVGTLRKMPFRTRAGRAWGPGILDMKAGVAMALTAIQVLTRTGLLSRPVILLLSGDEESGSASSRQTIESLAGRCAEVFVVEPAQGPAGAYKTARKGVGAYRLLVKGVASHAGVDFERGHSAVRELARQIERIAGFTDLRRGTTVNPGLIAGGTRTNVVAAEAWAEFDLRVSGLAEARRMDARLHSLRPFDSHCSLEVSGGINRPPMERTAGNAALFRRAATISAAMGMNLQEAATGGGSDGNFTSALGIPTLDGMGAVGEGAHADNESVFLDSLVPRTALLAAMIATSGMGSGAGPISGKR